jgi:hypothetical protein
MIFDQKTLTSYPLQRIKICWESETKRSALQNTNEEADETASCRTEHLTKQLCNPVKTWSENTYKCLIHSDSKVRLKYILQQAFWPSQARVDETASCQIEGWSKYLCNPVKTWSENMYMCMIHNDSKVRLKYILGQAFWPRLTQGWWNSELSNRMLDKISLQPC